MTAKRRVRVGLGIAVACAAFVFGCGDDDGPTAPKAAPPDTFDVAITPLAGFHRLMETYSGQDAYWYDKMLTRDFRYLFSAEADPALVTEFGNSWGVVNEAASTEHLFAGFQNENAEFLPAAVSIVVSIPDATTGVDPDHPDSTAHYARVNSNFITIDITLADDLTYAVFTPVGIDFVRGDVAVLGEGQPADSTVYYVRRIVDRSTPFKTIPRVRSNAAVAATWGAVRAHYLR